MVIPRLNFATPLCFDFPRAESLFAEGQSANGGTAAPAVAVRLHPNGRYFSWKTREGQRGSAAGAPDRLYCSDSLNARSHLQTLAEVYDGGAGGGGSAPFYSLLPPSLPPGIQDGVTRLTGLRCEGD